MLLLREQILLQIYIPTVCMKERKETILKTNKLFRRDFTMVVAGQIISLFGNAVLRFALPLYLLKETGSAALFGLVTACSFLPMIVFSLLGGVVADRVNKRNIMVALDYSTALLVLGFSLLLGKAPLVPLFIVVMMLLYGIQGAYQPSVQASLPAIVEPAQLISANAVVNQVNSLSGLLGPVIGGMLYGAFGISSILAVSILCFAVSATMEIFIHIPHERRKASGTAIQTAAADLKESYCFIRDKQPIFFRIALVVTLFNMVLSAVMVIGLPYLLVEILGVNDRLFGISQGVMGLGGITGGILAGMLGNKLKIRKIYMTMFVCSLCVAPMGIVMILGLPVMSSYLVITALSLAGMSSSTVFAVQMLSYVQMKTPGELVGKVIAAILAVSTCAHPIGQSVYGVLFETFKENAGWVMLLAAVAGAVIALLSAGTFRHLEEGQD